MKSFESIEKREKELQHSRAVLAFHRNPSKWALKWMLGKGVYLTCLVAPPLLSFWYYYVFMRWRNR